MHGCFCCLPMRAFLWFNWLTKFGGSHYIVMSSGLLIVVQV